jgi:hypothetical protein
VDGETRFTIAEHDTYGKRIALNEDIPELVKTGIEAYGSNKKWMLMKDYGSNCIIDSISNDGTYDWMYYTNISSVISGAYVDGNYVQFFNPFMNYNFVVEAPTLNLGVAGTWNSLGMQSQGLWKTEDAGQGWFNVSDGYFKTGSVGAVAVAARRMQTALTALTALKT